MEKETPMVKYVLFFLFALVLSVLFLNRDVLLPQRSPKSTQTLTEAAQITGGENGYTTYNLNVPKGWTVTKETSKDKQDILTVSKGSYKIHMYQQENQELLNCNVIIAENKDVLGDTTKTDYKELKAKNGNEYIRSIIPPNPNARKTSNSICQKTTEGFTIPTEFGVIEYETPVDVDEAILKEMDAMIISLQK